MSVPKPVFQFFFTNSAILVDILWYLIMVLIRVSGNWCWIAFHVLISWSYVFGKVFVFCGFLKIGLSIIIELLNSLHVLDTNLFSNICFVNIFIQSLAYSPNHFLKTLCYCDEVQFIFFFFMVNAFCVLRNLHVHQENLLLYSPQKFCIFSFYI